MQVHTLHERVHTLHEIGKMLSTDISEGGMFIANLDAVVGDELTVEFEPSDLAGVRFVARVVVVYRKPDGSGSGVRFERFEEGGTELARFVKHLLDLPAA